MEVRINVSESRYTTYTIQCENVTWTVDDEGNILGESIVDREFERERTLV